MNPERDNSVPIDASALPSAFDARSDFEAQCVRAILEDVGIQSVTVPNGSNIFGFPMQAGNRCIPVRVTPEDLSRAKQAIAEAKFVGRSIDWDEADMGEISPDVARTAGRGVWARRVRHLFATLGFVALLLLVASLAAAIVRSVWFNK